MSPDVPSRESELIAQARAIRQASPAEASRLYGEAKGEIKRILDDVGAGRMELRDAFLKTKTLRETLFQRLLPFAPRGPEILDLVWELNFLPDEIQYWPEYQVSPKLLHVYYYSLHMERDSKSEEERTWAMRIHAAIAQRLDQLVPYDYERINKDEEYILHSWWWRRRVSRFNARREKKRCSKCGAIDEVSPWIFDNSGYRIMCPSCGTQTDFYSMNAIRDNPDRG
jgi:hypothetical protein